MTDSTVVTDKKEEENKEKSVGQEVREKTFSQLLHEQSEARRNAGKDTPSETSISDAVSAEEQKKKEDDVRLAKEAEDAKRKIEEDNAAKRRDEELARKAADEVIAKQRAEEQAKADKLKAEEAEKERQKSLQPKWKTDPDAPKDKDGNPIPRSYDEIAAEAARIGKEEAKAEMLAELEAREKRTQDAIAKQALETEQKKAQAKAFEDQLQKELDTDLNDLYAHGKLPKIKNKDDEKDPGNVEFRRLFETAQKVNADRLAKGEQPIRSIKLIFYEHYKPLEKPSGHNAPVLGSESPITRSAPEDRYIPSRDRNKTMTQLLKEEAARLSRKLNVRGM